MSDELPPDDPRYRPLGTEKNIINVEFGGKAQDDDDAGECVMPVPDDAPPAPKIFKPGQRAPDHIASFRDANGRLLYYVYRNDARGVKKKVIFPVTYRRFADGRHEWVRKGPGGLRSLYNLDRLAARPSAPVLICEGEKKTDAAERAFPDYVCVSPAGGSGATERTDWAPVRGRECVVSPDLDRPGAEFATKVAGLISKLNCRVSILDIAALAGLTPGGGRREGVKRGWDIDDAVAEWRDNLEGLRAAILRLAKPYEAPVEDPGERVKIFNDEVVRLAKVSLAEYEIERKQVAKNLNVRSSAIDDLVRKAKAAGCDSGPGRPIEFVDPEPWPQRVDGAALVAEIEGAIKKYVVLASVYDAFVVALWVIHSYCFQLFNWTPRLAIIAPDKGCGKTTLLDCICRLVLRALSTENVSTAAIFRTIEAYRPTLLIDEADSFLGGNDDMRGVLNSGHRANGNVLRVVGDDLEPRAFSTFCPVVIAQIGKLPGTLADRSIYIAMKRRTKDEPISRFRTGRTEDLDEAARKIARWVADNLEAIRGRDPQIPGSVFNRAADNWEPLLAIAEVIGGEVAERTRAAAIAACGTGDDESQRVMLLCDIREIFLAKGTGTEPAAEVPSADLVAGLVAMADRPWSECNNGRALTTNGLARRLRDYSIKTKNIGEKDGRAKGYAFASFADAFARYAPISPMSEDSRETSVHSYTANEITKLDAKQSVHRKSWCTDQNRANAVNLNEVYACTDGKGVEPEEGEEIII